MNGRNIITVLSRALNLLDYRIIDHGQRVAYIIYKMLLAEGRYTGKDLFMRCFLSALHDIGAYKTEEIDSLTNPAMAADFEIRNTLNHSAYGYLFLKEFSVLDELSEAILFHHFRYDYLVENHISQREIAAKIFLADRVDILLSQGTLKIDESLFSEYRDTVFCANDIDLMVKLEKEDDLTEKLTSGEYMETLTDFYALIELDETETLSFLKTLAYLIDFRSEFTVLHNIGTVNFSVEIGKLFGLSGEELNKIYFGALLHDVGKISTSVAVLEKIDKLNDFEYKMIQDHVIVTESILMGCVDEEILKIAARHHEKLDGTGYPRGLSEKDLTFNEQIVAVSDILSALYGKRSYKDAFPADKIKSILQDMADNRKISKPIVDMVTEHYDLLVAQVEISCQKLIGNYNNLKTQHEKIMKQFS